MLHDLTTHDPLTVNPVGFIDWMEIERIDGSAIDVGLYRHYIDPMRPFASALRPHVHGMAITSASLRDPAQYEDGQGWDSALHRSGANYLTQSPQVAAFDSPFDYAQQSRVYILNDLNKDEPAQMAAAYAALFLASGGGGLGLFTAISRLRAVHEMILPRLEEAGISLYAQHADGIDTGTLVDMFRDDPHACLLGTDALRDGVDVAGDSLRLVIFDRVPWPRPTILHRARREYFGPREDPRAYDDMITRFKLRQGFGRLIRTAKDRGVFVMCDPRFPSRLQRAFPPQAHIIKCGLTQAVQEIRLFLHPNGAD
jgi:ATP-dependent DNA helicase DinG